MRIEKLQHLCIFTFCEVASRENGKYFGKIQHSVRTLNAKHRKKKRKKPPSQGEKKQIGLCFIGVHKLDTLLNSRKFVS